MPAVFSGTVVSGSVRVGDELLLGPLEGGEFRRVAVTSIHRSKVEAPSAQQGQHAMLAVQSLDGAEDAAAAAAAGGAGGRAAPPAKQQQQQPTRHDSAGCLHAWMQQTGSVPNSLDSLAPQSPLGAGTAASATQQQAQAVTHATPTVDTLAQTPRHEAAAELLHSWGSSPQLATASSGPAPRPRKVSLFATHSLLQRNAATQLP